VKPRLPAVLSLFLLLAVGCDGGWSVPGIDTQDFRITFQSAVASPSCGEADAEDPTAMVRAASNFEEFEQIYRIHFPDGSNDPRFDLYWKAESDKESSFTFFAAGTLIDGTMETGSLSYAGGAFQEDRSQGRVTFEIDGRVRTEQLGQWKDGYEDFIITDSTNSEAYPVGCVFTVNYEGVPLAAQGDESSDEGDED